MEEMILDNIKEGQYEDLRVSDFVIENDGDMDVTGQRLNDLYFLTISCAHIDDYDLSIIASIRQKHKGKDLMIVDSHPNSPMVTCNNVHPFSKEAYMLDQLVERVVDKLSKKPLRKAKIGTSILNVHDYTIFSLLIEGKEKTLYFIEDTNGITESETELITNIAASEGIKNVRLLSTDTHALSLSSLIKRRDTPKKFIKESIEKAMENLKCVKIYNGETLLNGVKIFGEAYYELATMVRILSRVTPVLFLLLFLFLSLFLWIF
jgi:predicted neutral ceramidase superfamily lipid hydrolase